jgi:hypothetical protein
LTPNAPGVQKYLEEKVVLTDEADHLIGLAAPERDDFCSSSCNSIELLIKLGVFA